MINSDKMRVLTTLLITMVMCLCMCVCFCACGSEGSVEETVEITTPSDENAAKSDDGKKIYETEAKNDDGSDSSDESDKDVKSQYGKIYKDCNDEMSKATKKYVGELKEKAGSVSKNTLYDETQDRLKKLEDIYDDGKEKMVDAMLKSTEDDEEEYKKYFNKMTEKYTEYTREITSAYTDMF